MTDSPAETSDSKFKMGISVWLSICLFVCLWFLSRFMKGRSQLRNNLHVIEDGLRRMQEDIEQRQRENSMGYGENLEEIMKELEKENLVKPKEERKDPTETTEGKEKLQEEKEPEELLIQDKKND